MATNFYFNNYTSSNDQTLYEDLTIEAIKMYGHDVLYIPRTLNNYDPIYGEDAQSSYENVYPIEMYIKNTEGFGGDQDFISRYAGLEIHPTMTFTVARRTFTKEVTQYNDQLRPNEGDLIWFTMNQRLFQITFVNKYEIFYQVGQLVTWELTAKLFTYSNETINTGIEEVDSIQTSGGSNVLDWGVTTEEGFYLTDEFGNYILLEGSPVSNTSPIIDDSDDIQLESDDFIDFTQVDPFSEGKI